jgi:hypothetical protein
VYARIDDELSFWVCRIVCVCVLLLPFACEMDPFCVICFLTIFLILFLKLSFGSPLGGGVPWFAFCCVWDDFDWLVVHNYSLSCT